MVSSPHHHTHKAGSMVYGADQERIGVLEEHRDGWLRIREGLLFKKERYLPAAAIANYVGEDIYLSIPRDVAERIARDAPPPPDDPWYTSVDEVDITTPIMPATPHKPA